MQKLYTNTMPFYIRDLSITDFGILGGPRTNFPQILRDDYAYIPVNICLLEASSLVELTPPNYILRPFPGLSSLFQNI